MVLQGPQITTRDCTAPFLRFSLPRMGARSSRVFSGAWEQLLRRTPWSFIGKRVTQWPFPSNPPCNLLCGAIECGRSFLNQPVAGRTSLLTADAYLVKAITSVHLEPAMDQFPIQESRLQKLVVTARHVVENGLVRLNSRLPSLNSPCLASLPLKSHNILLSLCMSNEF
jgi:hypothetical protein